MNTRLQRALAASECARARVQGMKIAARENPPRAAPPGFPYPHKTCAEWIAAPKERKPRKPKPVWFDMPADTSTARYRKDAVRGSAQLRDAIRRAG
jgi:hypothetical protein